MATRDRVKKYRQTGGGSDLQRVEVLVPSSKRTEIVAHAARMRAEHRERKLRIEQMCDQAIESYGVRLLDNIDLDRVVGIERRGPVIANALMERGDARAFAMGRRILDALEE
ncbi:hypothetical protein AB4144_02555 [Rhizobiaceae sp. 2RAB30]